LSFQLNGPSARIGATNGQREQDFIQAKQKSEESEVVDFTISIWDLDTVFQDDIAAIVAVGAIPKYARWLRAFLFDGA